MNRFSSQKLLVLKGNGYYNSYIFLKSYPITHIKGVSENEAAKPFKMRLLNPLKCSHV